jgi:hypothetical protein
MDKYGHVVGSSHGGYPWPGTRILAEFALPLERSKTNFHAMRSDDLDGGSFYLALLSIGDTGLPDKWRRMVRLTVGGPL